MRYLVVSFLFVFSFFAYSQDLTPFKIYNSKGKQVSFKKVLKGVSDADVVLFGELHNSAISHWVQLRMIEELHQNHKLAFGAEMFERDNQALLNDYLSEKIDQDALDTLARLWSNYKTDYKPLVDFAKKNELDFVASNIPRRFASLVYHEGFEALDTLSSDEKKWIANLPIPYDPELPAYQEMLTMMSSHANENFPKAQAIKDATMGESIVKYLDDINVDLFIHFNGAYHSNNYEGIFWYLNQYNPELKIKTISTVLQSDINRLTEENKGVADFILVVDEKMITTY